MHDLRDEVEGDHSNAAEADALVHAVVKDWRDASLSRADRALCEFAAKLTHTQDQVNAQDLNTLREQGFGDRAIHDAVQVIAYFNYINRVAEAVRVDLEPEMPPYGC